MALERSNLWSDNSTLSESNDKEAAWDDFGKPMNAISLGFVATAILGSMFLIMAIFEHLLKSSSSYPPSQTDGHDQEIPVELSQQEEQMHPVEKINGPQYESGSKMIDFSVLMPGQRYPTYLAQPAPLPCPREDIQWPHHYHRDCSSHYPEIPH